MRTAVSDPAVSFSSPSSATGSWSGQLSRVIIPLLALACLLPIVTPPIALAAGMLAAVAIGNPYSTFTKRASKILLQTCVILLGFGMDLLVVLRAGRDGLLFAAVTILGTFAAGALLGRWLKIDRKLSALVSSGTAICGGSAVAAVGSVIGAGECEMTVAMGTVFLLNAVALYIFPPIGHALHLSQEQFGTWAGVAIHDVSSVVGAASRYGVPALHVATAVKLSRALWIIPVTFMAAAFFRQPPRQPAADESPDNDRTLILTNKRGKMQIPWFIGLFLIASVIRTASPLVASHADQIRAVATRGLTITLFLIGAGLTRATLRAVGWKSMVQGIALFLLISCSSVTFIRFFERPSITAAHPAPISSIGIQSNSTSPHLPLR